MDEKADSLKKKCTDKKYLKDTPSLLLLLGQAEAKSWYPT